MSANAEIIAELRRVLNERDEAREQLDLTKRELGRWVDRETKAARERDEALATLERVRMQHTRCELELRRIQDERNDAVAQRDERFRDGVTKGWNSGAEAMRAYAARWIERECANATTAWHVSRLPIPEYEL